MKPKYYTKTLLGSCLLGLALCSSVSAADYYVSLSGSNKNSGTSVDQPFLTVQHAVNRMWPGDTCHIRGGTYTQLINLNGVLGGANAPITIKSYNGEKVIIDGKRAITSNWTKDVGNVYKTTINKDITQLFVDGKIMTLARHPNAPVFSDTCWSYGERLQRDGPNTNGVVLDEALRDINVPLNNCVAVVNFHTHRTRARLVKDHVPGADTFNYNPLPNIKGGRGYFFEGGLNNAERVLLDTSEEWAYDESTKTLYLWTDDGKNPNGRSIRGKEVVYALTGNADTQNVVIDGLDFESSTFHFVSSDGITIQNCNFDYYVNSRRALGDIETPRTAFFEGSELDNCTDIEVFNCEFKHADGSALWGLYTDNMVIENNLFKEIDYACVNPSDDFQTTPELHYMSQSTISSYEGKDTLYRRNTVDTAGSGQGVFFVAYGFVNPWVCEFNLHTRCALMETDTSSVYSPLGDVVESVARNNWFIANRGRDFRWDGANKKTVDGRDANFYRNVMIPESSTTNKGISGAGARLKGDYHEVYNNTAIYQGAQLNVASDKGGNYETTTYNNAADVFTADPIPGTASNNYDSENEVLSLRDLLRDPENFDFRPRADATALIDKGRETTCEVNDVIFDVTAGYNGAAPDIGAYEFGDDYYWIAGRQEAHSSMPIPKDGAVNVPTDADLMYLIALNGSKTRIYLGESPDNLTWQALLNSQFNIVSPDLEEDTTYYWRVDTKIGGKWMAGEVWSFKTDRGPYFIEAEDYTDSSGVDIGATTDDGGGQVIGNIRDGDWAMYANIDLTDISSIDVRTSTIYSGNEIEIRLDSPTGSLIGTVATTNTEDWNVYTTDNASISSTNGTHNVYLVFRGANKFVCNLNWLEFKKREEVIVTLRKRNANGFALDGGNGGANGQNVSLGSFNSSNTNQQFIEVDRGNGFYSYIKLNTNFALDGGNGGETGQNLYLWQNNPNNQNQQWEKVSVGGNIYQLKKRNATGFSIDGGKSGSAGQNVYLWGSNSSNQNQHWIIE